jgi:hypothetical protein
VEHRKGLPWLRLGRRGVTGDQTQALGPGVETVAFEHAPDQCEQAQAAAIEDIILGHGGASSAGF